MPKYQTTWPRVLLGICTGAFTGASIFVAYILFERFPAVGLQLFDLSGLLSFAGLFIYIFALWIIGILLIGSVPWFILHRLNMRSWPVAMALGFAPLFALTMVIFTEGFGWWQSTGISFYPDSDRGELPVSDAVMRARWQQALVGALLYGTFGAIVGLAVWRAAYKNTMTETTTPPTSP